MAQDANDTLRALLRDDEPGILNDWLEQQFSTPGFRGDRIGKHQMAQESRRFLEVFSEGLSQNTDVGSPAWASARQLLEELSASRAEHGFTPLDTAAFVFSLKQVLFERIRGKSDTKPAESNAATWTANLLLDRLGLYTVDAFQRTRERVIIRQQQEMMELSTPVVTLWNNVLALPLIGTLDSARTQVVMENLLQRIVDTGAHIAIIDITGVPTVDTLTAQHLLKTVAAARLMGADCIISGIRPQIAQTIVHLGVDLGTVVTKATLADAFAIALRRLGLAVTPVARAPRRTPGTVEPGPDSGTGN